MLSTTPLRTLRTRAGAGVGMTTKRFASHGAPHYNEPTGYLFGEKVRRLNTRHVGVLPPLTLLLPSSRQPPGRSG